MSDNRITRKHTYELLRIIDSGIDCINEIRDHYKSTSAAIYNKVNFFVKLGLVKKEKGNGRRKKPTLTEKGERVFRAMDNIEKELKGCDESPQSL